MNGQRKGFPWSFWSTPPTQVLLRSWGHLLCGIPSSSIGGTGRVQGTKSLSSARGNCIGYRFSSIFPSAWLTRKQMLGVHQYFLKWPSGVGNLVGFLVFPTSSQAKCTPGWPLSRYLNPTSSNRGVKNKAKRLLEMEVKKRKEKGAGPFFFPSLEREHGH